MGPSLKTKEGIVVVYKLGLLSWDVEELVGGNEEAGVSIDAGGAEFEIAIGDVDVFGETMGGPVKIAVGLTG